MKSNPLDTFSGVIIDDSHHFSLADICQSCHLPAEQVLRMVDQGILEPINLRSTVTRWQFHGNSLMRVRTVVRLQQDLGVNLAGAALALELLDEIKSLRQSRFY